MEIWILTIFLFLVVSMCTNIILHKLKEIKDMLEAEG